MEATGSDGSAADDDASAVINPGDLEVLGPVSRGSFSSIYVAQDRHSGCTYALKVVNKELATRYKQLYRLQHQKDVLGSVRHPFIVRLHGTWHDAARLYLAMGWGPGGDLFDHLNRSDGPGYASVDDTRFYGACLILALEYLHSRSVLHRYLVTEHVVIGADGYPLLTGFGAAKQLIADRTYTMCGFGPLMPPEMIISKGYGPSVDYWALGLLLYECLCGANAEPFDPATSSTTASSSGSARNQFDVTANMMMGRVYFPPHVTDVHARDLVIQLLQPVVSKRLGCGPGPCTTQSSSGSSIGGSSSGGASGASGSSDGSSGGSAVRAHPFFAGVSWQQLLQRKASTPWRPDPRDPTDASIATETHSEHADREEEVFDLAGVAPWDRDF